MVNHLLQQFLGLSLLILGVGLGYRRWVRPHREQINGSQRILLLLVILTLVGGFVGSFGWWLDVPNSFSWDLPPLAARMLAAAGWSFALACWLALERPSPSNLRLIILMLFIYLTPLTVAIGLFHLDRFDWTAPITYAFFAIVAAMIAVATWHLRYPTTILQGEDEVPVASVAHGWLLATAILTALWGLALFLTDEGPSSLIWVWPGDLLTSRLIAVMLWTLSAAAIYSLRSRGAVRIALAVMIAYGLGVVVANLWNMTAVKLLYVLLFALIAIGSGAILWLNRQLLRSDHPSVPES